MNADKTGQYIELLEENLNFMQQRQELMQKVQNNYGNHKADKFLRSIRELDVQIEQNNNKLKKIKQEKT